MKRTIDEWVISKDVLGAHAKRGGVTLYFSAFDLEVSIEPQLDPGGRSPLPRFPDEWSVPLEVIDALREMSPTPPPEANEGGPGMTDRATLLEEDPGPWLKRLRVFLGQAPLRLRIWLAYGRCSGCGSRDTQTRYVGSWFGRRRRHAMCRRCWRADV